MAGIYIHIPFCRQACSYCNFHFSTSLKPQNAMVDAICRELELRSNEVRTPVHTVYFGGGSPSILDAENLDRIFLTLREQFNLSTCEEFTLETNPDDHTPEKLEHWLRLGVNRLSIGIQSFLDRDLKLMNRAHTAEDALKCVQRARSAGFESMSIDLIYGVPHQGLSEWEDNVRTALQLNCDHISAYCLTVEPKTALHYRESKGEVQQKSDEVIEEEFLRLRALLTAAMYDHYELSNFAKPGKESQHNAAYWSGAPYLGIGPSAHSFDGAMKRSWNASNNAIYMKSISQSELPSEVEDLSERERDNEKIMTGLRRAKGILLSELSEAGRLTLSTTVSTLNPRLKTMLILDKDSLRMVPDCWLMSDALVRELIQ